MELTMGLFTLAFCTIVSIYESVKYKLFFPITFIFNLLCGAIGLGLVILIFKMVSLL